MMQTRWQWIDAATMAAILALALVVFWWFGGCAGFRMAPAAQPPASQPAVAGDAAVASSGPIAQQGGFNLADAVDIGIQFGMPVGVTVIMLALIACSHRREMRRIKQGAHRGKDSSC